MGFFDNFVQERRTTPLAPVEAGIGLMIIAYQSLFTEFPYRPLFEEDYDFFLGYVNRTQFLGKQNHSVLTRPHTILENVQGIAGGQAAVNLFATYIPAISRNSLFTWYCQLVFDEDNICSLPMDEEHRVWCYRTMDVVRRALGVDDTMAAKIADVMYLRGKL